MSNASVRWPGLRSAPWWLPAALTWLAALLVLAVVAQTFVANSRLGQAGSSEELPLGPVPSGGALRPTSMTTPVVVVSRYSTSKRFKAEVTPVSVVEGDVGDLNLANPAAVAGMRVFYVTWTVRYLGGYAVPGDPNIALRLPPGPQGTPLLPNGMKNWNPTSCQPPRLRPDFTFGKGTTLTVCRVNLARPGDPVSTLQLEPGYKGVILNQPHDVRWPVQAS